MKKKGLRRAQTASGGSTSSSTKLTAPSMSRGSLPLRGFAIILVLAIPVLLEVVFQHKISVHKWVPIRKDGEPDFKKAIDFDKNTEEQIYRIEFAHGKKIDKVIIPEKSEGLLK